MTERKKTGQKPVRVKIEAPWQDAVEAALKKQRPKNGWPTPKGKKSKKKG